MSYLFLFLFAIFNFACAHQDWRTADHSSVGIAPLPKDEPRAIVQVYAARAFNWRGYFAVHSWIAIKNKNADHYTTYHVIGFRIKSTGSAVVIKDDLPDRKWYGAVPYLVTELRGEKAELAIPKIQAAALSYPYPTHYRAWPGPNSNTFVSYIIRRVPEIGVELPPHAIGKDWIDDGDLFGLSESGTGMQMSVYGVLGFTLGLAEGIELNILGMSFGVDLWRPALKLPFIGRVGVDDDRVFD
jgi:Protein of unknown function (DUF3750)